MKYVKSFEFFKNPFKKLSKAKKSDNKENYIIDWMKKNKLERINFSLLPEIKIIRIGRNPQTGIKIRIERVLREINITPDGLKITTFNPENGSIGSSIDYRWLEKIVDVIENMSEEDIEKQVIDQEANKFNF